MNTVSHKIESSVAGCGYNTDACGGELIISRLFDAPRELVWKVWTDPGLLCGGGDRKTSHPLVPDKVYSGWADPTFTACNPRRERTTGVPVCFREINRPKKIVCTDSFADEKGNVVPATS